MCVCLHVFILYFQNPVWKAIESKSHTDTHRTHTQTHTDSHAHTGEKIKAAPYQTAATKSKRRDKNKNNNSSNEIRFYKRNQEIRFYIERYFVKIQ